MSQKKTEESILDGVRDILMDSLNIQNAVERIRQNWSKKKSRSSQNWRIKKVPLPDPAIAKRKVGHRGGSEVLLERTITTAFAGDDRLWNQMPVASGLLPTNGRDGRPRARTPSEGRRAIDLVFQREGADGPIEFLELKVTRSDQTSDTLRHAAYELLEYGVLYLFSRLRRSDLGYSGERYKVLNAPCIRLRVLAPSDYYKGQDISQVPIADINAALKKYLANGSFPGLEIDFGFEVLADCADLRSSFLDKETWNGNSR